MNPDWAVAGAVVAGAALCRLPRLLETPGWDGDEGYNLEIAWQLLHGRAQAFALSYAFVQHPVLFYAAAAPLLALFGRELWVIRALAGLAGSLTAGLLYLAARASGRRVAALAALAFAVAHFTTAYNRFGYTYNLLLFWSALTLLLVLRWPPEPRRRHVLAAGGAAALGQLTDQAGIFLPAFVALSALPRRRLAVEALLAGALPAAIAAALMWAWQPDAASQDWPHTFARLAAPAGAAAGWPVRWAAAFARWVVNYLHLLRAEWWWPAAVIGLFCIRPLAVRRRVLLLAGLMAVPIFALRELEPFFRSAIPLLLPAAWGLGAVLDAGIAAVYSTVGAPPPGRGLRPAGPEVAPEAAPARRDAPCLAPPLPPGPAGRTRGRDRFAGIPTSDFRLQTSDLGPRLGRRALAAVLAALVVLLPLGLEAGRTAGALAAGFRLRIDWALAADQRHAREAAAFVNARAEPGDVVIVSPHVSWLFDGAVADFLQAVARQGQEIAFYPAGLPASRFRFDPSPASARYAVLDGYWDLWAAESDAVARLVAECEAWPLLWRGGGYRVHRRPDGPDRPADRPSAAPVAGPRSGS